MAQLVDTIAERGNGLLMLLGRVAIAVLYLPSGFRKLTNIAGFAGYLAGHGVAGPVILLAWLAAIVEFFGSLAILLGFQTRLAAAAVCVFTVIAAFIGHPYWADAAAAEMNDKLHFMKDIAIAGGLLFLFVRGAGPLSIDRR